MAVLPGLTGTIAGGGKLPGAAPVVAASATDTGSNTSSTALNLPASISAGDLLLLFVSIGRDSAVTVNTPSGWSVLFDEVPGVGNNRRLTCFYKIASGSEGSTVTVTSSIAADWASVSLRITGYTSRNAMSSIATGTDASAECNTAVAEWYKDNLNLAICCHNASGNAPTSPSGFTQIESAVIASGSSIRCTVSQKNSDDQSVTPAAFTLSASLNWATKTIILG